MSQYEPLISLSAVVGTITGNLIAITDKSITKSSIAVTDKL